MKSTLKLSLIAGMLVATSVAYSGQRGGQWNDNCEPMMGSGSSMQGYGMQGNSMRNMDPARMQAMMEQRDAVLKAQLKLTPAQEAAWNTFVEARQPAAMQNLPQRPDPVEMAKLTTPERLDKMKQMRTERMSTMYAAMDKYDAATRAFYAELTPDQQKVFDVAAAPGQGRNNGGRNAMRNAPAAKQ